MRLLVFLLSLPLVAADWVSLFDGKSLNGWMWSTEANPPEPSWAAEDGMLRTTPGKGKRVYLLTRDSFRDFEFEFEWKTEPGGNSGVKYRFQGYWADNKLSEAPGGSNRIEPVALEYQLADDEKHPDAVGGGSHSTAAIYEYVAAKKDRPVQANAWHKSRILARGLHIEHWLDGQKVVDADIDSPAVQEAFAKSKRKGSSPVLAKQERRESPIALQFHDETVWFRNLRIRRLE